LVGLEEIPRRRFFYPETGVSKQAGDESGCDPGRRLVFCFLKPQNLNEVKAIIDAPRYVEYRNEDRVLVGGTNPQLRRCRFCSLARSLLPGFHTRLSIPAQTRAASSLQKFNNLGFCEKTSHHSEINTKA
jgi:hypothetical protein